MKEEEEGEETKSGFFCYLERRRRRGSSRTRCVGVSRVFSGLDFSGGVGEGEPRG